MLISSPEAMINFGKKYAQEGTKGILLYGDLGTGKTHFCKGFAAGLSIDPALVHSPTYTYVNIYENKLLHIDMYRLTKKEDFIKKGILSLIEEYVYVMIERPKREEEYTNEERKKIQLTKMDEMTREVS